MFDKLKGVEDRFVELEGLLSDPKVVQDRGAFQKYAREHAEINEIVNTYRVYQQINHELDDTLELLKDDLGKLSLENAFASLFQSLKERFWFLLLFAQPPHLVLHINSHSQLYCISTCTLCLSNIASCVRWGRLGHRGLAIIEWCDVCISHCEPS